MFKFDDRYIILVILLPGIFLLGNVLISFKFLPFGSLIFSEIEFGFSETFYSLVLAMILGSFCWYLHKKKWIEDAFDTSALIKELEKEQVFGNHINIDELQARYLSDFKIPFFNDNCPLSKKKNSLKGSIDNIFFTMDRAIGLEKPSAYRLLLDMLSALVVATYLSVLFLLSLIFIFCLINFYQSYPIQSIVWIFSGFLMTVFLLLKYLVIPELRNYYHYTIIIVYLDNQYRFQIEQFINANTTVYERK